MFEPHLNTAREFLINKKRKLTQNCLGCLARYSVDTRGCSHMRSAKNGGVQTPSPPLVSQSQKLAYPPTPLVRKKSETGLPPLPPLSEIRF